MGPRAKACPGHWLQAAPSAAGPASRALEPLLSCRGDPPGEVDQRAGHLEGCGRGARPPDAELEEGVGTWFCPLCLGGPHRRLKSDGPEDVVQRPLVGRAPCHPHLPGRWGVGCWPEQAGRRVREAPGVWEAGRRVREAGVCWADPSQRRTADRHSEAGPVRARPDGSQSRAISCEFKPQLSRCLGLKLPSPSLLPAGCFPAGSLLAQGEHIGPETDRCGEGSEGREAAVLPGIQRCSSSRRAVTRTPFSHQGAVRPVPPAWPVESPGPRL